MKTRNLHLILSIALIIPIALTYGLYPVVTLPKLFDFSVATVDLAGMLKATMGLYIGMSALWVMGIVKPKLWFTATITDMVFMGGLAVGRLISIITDGVAGIYFLAGLVVEISLALCARRKINL